MSKPVLLRSSARSFGRAHLYLLSHRGMATEESQTGTRLHSPGTVTVTRTSDERNAGYSSARRRLFAEAVAGVPPLKLAWMA